MTKLALVGLLAACVLAAGATLPGPDVEAAQPRPAIAFIRSDPHAATSHVFTVNADGSGLRQLTGGDVRDRNATWSPDGGRLVFERWTGARSADIFVVRANGIRPRRLTRTTQSWTPAWSPDGRRIAFATGARLFVMRPDGSHKRALTKRIPSRPLWPSWSPDGRRIAFSTATGLVYVVDADGSGQRRLARGDSFACPAWSPDGRRVAFVVEPFGYDSVYVIDASARGARERRVTRLAYTESAFAWSPDSRRIVYARRARGGVYTVDLDGTHDRRLTRNPLRRDMLAGGFSWSPGRGRIAYASDVTGDGDVYVMNADGTGQRQLTDGPDIDGAPRWSRSPRTESC